MAQNFKIVPDTAMFDAFKEGPAAKEYGLDAMRWNEFQRGWKEAIKWVNDNAVKHN